MVAKACAVLLAGVSIVGCSPFDAGTEAVQKTPGDSAFARLRTVALNLPRLESGQPCPFSKLKQLGPHLGTGLGSGPAYMLNGESVRSDTEHSNKVVWAVDPSYSGPIRIRGSRLDGSGQVLFDSFDNHWRGAALKTVDKTALVPELDLLESHSTFPNAPAGWRLWPSATHVATPGCYGWQVDGLGFTDVFTFHSLDVHTLQAGTACPISPQQVAHNLSPEFGYGPAVGTGPIYPLMGEMQDGVLRYSARSNVWAESKVLWMARPSVRGNVAIRGRQIDGQNWIGFGKADNPEFVLQWEIGSQSGWGSLPSTIRIRAPGCYAFQVDGQPGSEAITFQVVGIP
jgi:hypothetical protein